MDRAEYIFLTAMMSFIMFTVTHGHTQLFWFGFWMLDSLGWAWYAFIRDFINHSPEWLWPAWLRRLAQYKRWRLILNFPDRQLRDDVAKAYAEFMDSAKAEIDMELARKHKNNGKIKK